MSPAAVSPATVWLVVHLVAVAVLSGVGWVVQGVVYPAFALVGPDRWAAYHAAHTRAITLVVALPWLVQGVSTAALLLVPPLGGGRVAASALAVLALVTVVVTVAGAVPAHQRLGPPEGPPAGGPGAHAVELRRLLRANLVRTLGWTASTLLAARLLLG